MRQNRANSDSGFRGIAAAFLMISLVALGCSTNRTPGDGQPSMSAPSSPASTPGSSSGTAGNPPMASAAAVGASIDRANEAAAIVASHQRERFLGVINPSGPQTNLAQQAPPTGQLIPPSMYTNPQATVNASISSDPTPVITSGAGTGEGDGGIFIGSATTGATTGTTAASTVGATTGASTTSTTAAISSSALATPTTAAISATPGQFAAGPSVTSTATTGTTVTTNTGTLTPTLTSSATPSPTRAANPTLGTLRATQATTTTPATTTTASSTSTTSTSTRGARVVAPIRVVTNGNGTVTVTNVSSTPPTVIKSTGKQ